MSTPNPARQHLPTRPSEENLRKQAKTRARKEAISLSAAQHQLAADYGYRNWPELMRAVVEKQQPAGKNTTLWQICQSPMNPDDRLAAVRKLFAAGGVDVHRRSENGSTALHMAAMYGPAELVKLLLDHEARWWIEDHKGRKPVDYARDAKENPDRDQIVRMLSGIMYDDVYFEQAVAAMDTGDVDRLKELLREHPDLVTRRLQSDSALTRGYFAQPTLLHFVANNPGRLETMPPRILESAAAILDAGADVNASTPHTLSGTTLAMVASSEPAKQAGLQIPLLELLVARGADPAAGLWAAIIHRYTQAVEALLRLGAPHSLVSAAGMNDTAAVTRLLQGNPNHDELVQAAWAAAINGAADAMALLLDAGLNINVRLPRPFEPTLLHEAALNGHRPVVELLVKRRANLTVRDTQYDATPSGWAQHAGHQELAQWMENRSRDK